VLAAAEGALADFGGHADLAAARDVLADAEREQAAGRAELEVAVNAADVEAVMRLRGHVEITLAAKVTTAAIAVHDLEAAEAQARAEWSTQRRDHAQTALDATQHDVEKARAALEAAEITAKLAAGRWYRVNSAAATAEQRHAEIVATRDELKRAAADSQAARLRRLAGLAPEPVPPTTTKPELVVERPQLALVDTAAPFVTSGRAS
jgi:hypothetical protein